MKVDYSYQWYREMCEENGLDPDNVLSESTVQSAKQMAIEMKKYMNAKENYPDNERLQQRLDEQIKRLNNDRMELMIAALEQADVMSKMGSGADKFFRRYAKQQEYARR